jgi:polygalacturonase
MSTYVTILDYGGSGNGSTDNTSALNAAVNALGASGGQIIFPAGIYTASALLSLSHFPTSNL